MRKIPFFFILFIACLSLALYFYDHGKKSCTGTVIVLNGPSGAGKSSIQKAFQNLMLPNLWVKVGIDNLFDAPMPDITPENMNIWQSPNPIRWVETTTDESNSQVITLYVGDQGDRVAYAMNSAIAAFAQNGNNVIVDYIAYDQKWLGDLKQKLSSCKTYYIAVDIPLEILEERERARGTSPSGHARSHYHTVYGPYNYDLRVNSAQNSPEEIAQQIKEIIENNRLPD